LRVVSDSSRRRGEPPASQFGTSGERLRVTDWAGLWRVHDKILRFLRLLGVQQKETKETKGVIIYDSKCTSAGNPGLLSLEKNFVARLRRSKCDQWSCAWHATCIYLTDMKACQTTIAILTVSAAACFASEAQSEQSEALVEGNTAFALDLFSQLKANSGNLFFSPYGISTALALTYAGARGETEKQMRNVLHFANGQEVHSDFGLLQHWLLAVGKQEGIELSIANALWAEQGNPFLPAFLKTATGPYQANINQADFKTAADAARNQINAWVALQTRD